MNYWYLDTPTLKRGDPWISINPNQFNTILSLGGLTDILPDQVQQLPEGLYVFKSVAGSPPGFKRLVQSKDLPNVEFVYNQPGATEYDGISDLYGSATTIADTNSKLGTVSFWFKYNGIPSGDGFTIFNAMTNDYFAAEVYSFDDGGIKVTTDFYSYDTSGFAPEDLILQVSSGFTRPLDTNWHHVLISWDNDNSVGHLFFDDVEDTDNTNFNQPDVVVPYTGANYSIGTYVPVPSTVSLCLSEIYFEPGRYVDLTVESNRRKFITADLQPVNLRPNGSAPFGTVPLFYSKLGNGTNLTGNDSLTAFGTPSTCGSNP